jgi:hypothetical protein
MTVDLDNTHRLKYANVCLTSAMNALEQELNDEESKKEMQRNYMVYEEIFGKEDYNVFCHDINRLTSMVDKINEYITKVKQHVI